MFGLGFGEILVLAAIGLIVLGPKQMTELARVLGRTMAELKKAVREVTKDISLESPPPSQTQKTEMTGHGPDAVAAPVAPPNPPAPEIMKKENS